MTAKSHKLSLCRDYEVSRDLVWLAWTDAEHIAQWWGPFGPDKTISHIDAVIGGVFSVVMTAPDGSKHPSKGIIHEYDPPRKMVIEGDPDATDSCGAGLPPGAMITVKLEEVNGGTRLTLDAVFPSDAAQEAAKSSGYITSWTESLDVLELFLQHFTQ